MGPLARLVGGGLITVALAELIFGHADHVHLGPVPYPDGVPLGVLLNGAIVGILYGLVGMGIILVYRANRVISFAQAGLGSVPALAAILLVTNHGWPYPLAVVVTLAGAALTGAACELLIMRRFRNRPRVIATVATIGVAQLLALGEIKLPKLLADQSVPPGNLPTPFAGFRFSFEGVIFNGNHLAVVVVGVAMMTGLALFFQRTRVGVAVRAAAENSDRALLLGIPVARLSTIVWAIAGLCSGVAVFMRASVVGLPFGGVGLSPLILLYGLAAAVVAGMERLRVAIVAGMLVGVVEQASFYGTNRPDLGSALMLPLILLALLPRAGRMMRALDTGVASYRTLQEFRPIPVELRRLPEVRIVRLLLFGLGIAFFLTAPVYLGVNNLGFAQLVVIFAIVGVSMVVLSGWAGQVSLGQWAFAGVGAAVAGGLAANHGQDFFVTVAAAGAVGALIALVLGIPALRTQGLYLAVVTLAFAATTQNLFLDRRYTAWLLPDPYSPVAKPVLWQRLDTTNPVGFYYLCVGFLLLAYTSTRSIRRSRSARVMIATRDNVRAAQSLGVSSTRTRLAAFAISGCIAAVAGALLAYQQGAVDKQAFSLGTNIEVFIFAVVGGLTSVGGAIAGAVVYEGLHYVAQTYGLNGLDTLGIATGALFVLNFAPGGLAQAGFGMRDWLLRAVARRRGMVVPSLVADRGHESSAGIEARHTGAQGGPTQSLLSCRGLDVGYDSVQVLFGVDADVRDGEIVALLGTNGAGKSTLLRAISGLNAPTAGTIHFDGGDITRMGVPERCRLGIVQVPGGRSVFPTLTVEEHFSLARWAVDEGAASKRQEHCLSRFPALRDRYRQLAGNLSGGEQQQLGLAMAFIARPRLLIIDELSLGLAPLVVEQLLQVVRELRDGGTTVLLVEQSVNVALAVADRAYFMEKGEVRFEGRTAELLERRDILRSVFLQGAAAGIGGPEPTKARATARAGSRPSRDDRRSTIGETVLEVQSVAVAYGGVQAVDGVSLGVRSGEILGIIGPNGAGKTTLFDVISGFVRPATGRVCLKRTDVTSWPPDDRAWLGLGRSFQDARIFPAMTVAENIATAFERHLPMHDHVAPALCLPDVRVVEDDVAWSVSDLVELLGLGAYRDKFVRELSTGTRRIVDLAMVLAHDPAVLLLDEPSSGIAQRESEGLIDLLLRIREQTGCGMLVIEHDMPMVTAIADRMIALDLGSIIAEGRPQDVVRDARVVASYLGTDTSVVRRSGELGTIAALVEARQ